MTRAEAALNEVLVVDDEPQVLTAIEDTLEDDWIIHSATSAENAIKVVKENSRISVIISDQRMPNTDGAAFLSEVKTLTRATRILLTGFADIEAVVRAVNEGKIFAYLSKPWDPEHLRIVVHQAFNFYLINMKLDHERRLLANLMNSLPDAVYFKDREHRLIQANGAFAAAHGHESGDEVAGRTIFDLAPPDIAGDLHAIEEEILRTGEPIVDRIFRGRLPSGEPRWYSTTVAPVLDSTGVPSSLVGVTRDVTARMQTEAENRILLASSQALARSQDVGQAYENILQLIVGETDWLYGEVRKFDDARGQLVDGPARHQDNLALARFRERLRALAFAAGDSVPGLALSTDATIRVPDIGADGRVDAALAEAARAADLKAMLAVPLKGGDGVPQAVLMLFAADGSPGNDQNADLVEGIARQLAQYMARMTAQRALSESEQRFRSAFNSATHGIGLVDLDGRLRQVNAAFCAITGYSEDELSAVNFQSLTHPDDRPHEEENQRKLLADKIPSSQMEKRCLRKDGKAVPVISSLGLVRDEAGKPLHFVAQIIDISSWKDAEAKFLQAQKMEAVGHLTGGVAHDFNNLLTVITGSLDLLRSSLRDDNGEGRLVEMAQKAANRGADLTRRLLAFSRKQVLDPEVARVNALVAGMESLLRRTIGENVTIRTRLSADDPAVLVDVSQFENAIVNLVVNARDAMPDGGAIEIATEVVELDEHHVATHADAASGPHVAVVVTDDGAGIAPEVIDHVFEPFFTTKEVGKGTGLGLSMIYGFVRQTGGHIAIDSEPGRGTSVRLFFPRNGGQERPSTAVEQAKKSYGGTERILVVEDNADVRATIVLVLDSLGYEVLEAENGNEGLAVLQARGDIDLLLTDVVMPGGMSGPEMAAQALQLRPGLKVLVSSGYPHDTITSEGIQKQSLAFIGKPFEPKDLARRLRELLD